MKEIGRGHSTPLHSTPDRGRKWQGKDMEVRIIILEEEKIVNLATANEPRGGGDKMPAKQVLY